MPTTPNPAQVEHMRKQRTHLTVEKQCTQCGEAAWAKTDYCPARHAYDVDDALSDLETDLADLRAMVDQAGDCLPPDLLHDALTAITALDAATRIRAELRALGA